MTLSFTWQTVVLFAVLCVCVAAVVITIAIVQPTSLHDVFTALGWLGTGAVGGGVYGWLKPSPLQQATPTEKP